MGAGGRKAAQILAFPALKRIPEPSKPLDGFMRDKYIDLATSLFNSGKLNKFTQSTCETIAILEGAVAKRLEMSLPVSAKAMADIGKLMKELQLVDDSESSAPAPGGKENRYDKIGFVVSSRAQTA